MADSLILEVADLEVDVLTGIYSEETGQPQPLRISVSARMRPSAHYAPDTPLTASKNYMDLKFAASMSKGTLNVVSGVIAKLKPESVSVKTPTGEIGVRGTTYLIKVEPQ